MRGLSLKRVIVRGVYLCSLTPSESIDASWWGFYLLDYSLCN